MMSSFLSSSPMQKKKKKKFLFSYRYTQSLDIFWKYNTLFEELNQIYQTKSYVSLENVLLAMILVYF